VYAEKPAKDDRKCCEPGKQDVVKIIWAGHPVRMAHPNDFKGCKLLKVDNLNLNLQPWK